MSFIITCPICGRRDGYEFRYGGQAIGPRPEETGLTPAEYNDYVHMRLHDGRAREEWWCHRQGCNRWFTIWRDPMTNREAAPAQEPE
jgi:sarcosine oxidase subunit delta